MSDLSEVKSDKTPQHRNRLGISLHIRNIVSQKTAWYSPDCQQTPKHDNITIATMKAHCSP